MKIFRFSKKEIRIIIILMIINSFAFFVNYFKLSPNFDIDRYPNTKEIYLFTDSNAELLISESGGYLHTIYERDNPNKFWPFIKFYQRSWDYRINRYRFRGIFASYDHTEFIVYSIIIFGFFTIKKLW